MHWERWCLTVWAFQFELLVWNNRKKSNSWCLEFWIIDSSTGSCVELSYMAGPTLQITVSKPWHLGVSRFTYEFSWAYTCTFLAALSVYWEFDTVFQHFFNCCFFFYFQVGTCWWNFAVRSSFWLFVHANRMNMPILLHIHLYCILCFYTATILANDFPVYLSFTEVDSFTWRTSSYWWYRCWRLASSILCSSWTMYILLFILHR